MNKKLKQLIATYNWMTQAWDSDKPTTEPLSFDVTHSSLIKLEGELSKKFDLSLSKSLKYPSSSPPVNIVLYAMLHKAVRDMLPLTDGDKHLKKSFLSCF